MVQVPRTDERLLARLLDSSATLGGVLASDRDRFLGPSPVCYPKKKRDSSAISTRGYSRLLSGVGTWLPRRGSREVLTRRKIAIDFIL